MLLPLRAEYFYSQKAYGKISFNLTNGINVDYLTWMQGYRVIVNGNHATWKSPQNHRTRINISGITSIWFLPTRGLCRSRNQ